MLLPLPLNRGSHNSHVTVFSSILLVFQKSGILLAVNGAACAGYLVKTNFFCQQSVSQQMTGSLGLTSVKSKKI
jgi:hypothetical protein